MLTVGSLFSGIGGFELGLERAGGFKTEWQCEKDEFCLKVLAKHWPDVKRFTDIREMKEEIPYVDVICGGFPCQDISCAGKGAGIHAERSGLWWDMLRVIRMVRPQYVLVENVAALVNRGLDEVLGSLAECGYDAEWNILSAASVGAPHIRKRVFITARKVADPIGLSSQRRGEAGNLACQSGETEGEAHQRQRCGDASDDCGADVANSDQIGRHGWARVLGSGRGRESQDGGAELPDSQGERSERGIASRHQEQSSRMRFLFTGQSEQIGRGQWAVEPELGLFVDGLSEGLADAWHPGWEDGTPRVAQGQKDRVNRLRALGNAIVPQCAEYVGRCVLASMEVA